jgi:translation initiation factor IF-3
MNDKNKQKFNNLKQNRINNQITAKRVFLIDAAGEKIGAVSIFEAMDRANEVSMDLVEVSRSNELPCRN